MKQFLALILFAHGATAQKVVRKTLPYNSLKYLQIDAKNCYTTSVTATHIEELQIEATLEGEYTEDLAIRITENGNNILVSPDFLPNFKNPNDKLSAHKVISIALHVRVPLRSDVTVYGTSTAFVGSGPFKHLKVVLSDGDCSLNRTSGNIAVKTQNGNISAMGLPGNITATSTYGKLHLGELGQGFYEVNLESVTGNISVNNTK
ncbi:Hypothetical protein I595_1404 [Croceitalea dokdonensis DOKDO 023]|uniref:Uncharacterized protein n=1 Tax=Croceitalea dokdonensis DOKDO 023 TaxID=1300341 RepID=A0A0P7AWC0_9FLAO|nr:DUF4097 family beta strand repeat-containing protein [Croceitalea dokdonensis]KPM32977.1 Hypothetical protein I595_1404 [Croceitalea dokdonensis DOKDO 023]